MRRDAYAHLQQLSNTYFNNTKVGQIMGRITNDLFEVTEFAHHCPEEFFIAGLKIVISFIILARIPSAAYCHGIYIRAYNDYRMPYDQP